MQTATFHLGNGGTVTVKLESRKHSEFVSGVSRALNAEGSLSKIDSARLGEQAYGLGLAFYETASALLKRLRYDSLLRVERA